MTSPDRPTSSVDRKLLELLVCPITKGPLDYDSEHGELISRQAGLSTRALLLEWISWIGPRPQRSPLAMSSSSMTPLAPRVIIT